MKQKRVSTYFFIAVIIVSLALVVRWLYDGDYHLFDMAVRLNHPQVELVTDNGVYIIDNSFYRLIHIDKNNRVDRLLTFEHGQKVVDKIYLLDQANRYLYLSGVKTRAGGLYASSEHILRYDYLSNHIESVYTQEYSDSTFYQSGQIKCLWQARDSVFFLRGQEDNYTICGFAEQQADSICICESFATEEPISQAVVEDDGHLTLYGKYHTVWTYQNGLLSPSSRQWYEYKSDSQYAHADRIKYTPLLIAYHLLLMVAVLFILCSIVAGIRWLIRSNRLPVNGNAPNSGIVLGLAMAALLITGFYSHNLLQEYRQAYRNQICSVREQLQYLISTKYMDILEGVAFEGEAYCQNEEHKLRLHELNTLQSQMTQLPLLQQSMYTNLIYLAQDGTGIVVTDANNQFQFAEVIFSTEAMMTLLTTSQPELGINILDKTGSFVSSVHRFDVLGKTFFLEVGYNDKEVFSASTSYTFHLFLHLLILLLILYTGISLLRKLPNHVRKFRLSHSQSRPDAGVWLVGIMSFLFYAVSAIDQGIMVYLVYDLSEGCTASQLALRASLPMTLYLGVGMTAYLIQPALRKWFGDRTVNMSAGVLAVVVFVLMVFGIEQRSFLVYCLGKAMSGMLMGIIFNSMYALPLIARDNELRNEGLAAITMSCLAANILFISVGGYISQYIGYSAVYIINAALAVVVVFIAALIYPKSEGNALATEEQRDDHSLGDTLRFLLSGRMMTYYLGVLLPFGMMNAYCYYLYPIYAERAGISVSELASIIVFGYALAYLFGEKLVRWKNSQNGLHVLLGVVLIMATLLLAFFIAGNILWATLVLMLCCIMIAIPRSEANVFIAEESKHRNLDVRDTNSGFVFALDATESAASPLMGWCIGMGLTIGTNMIGAISLVLTVLFIAVKRKTE